MIAGTAEIIVKDFKKYWVVHYAYRVVKAPSIIKNEEYRSRDAHSLINFFVARWARPSQSVKIFNGVDAALFKRSSVLYLDIQIYGAPKNRYKSIGLTR